MTYRNLDILYSITVADADEILKRKLTNAEINKLKMELVNNDWFNWMESLKAAMENINIKDLIETSITQEVTE